SIEASAERFTSHIKIYTFNRQAVANPKAIESKIYNSVAGVKFVFPSISKESLIKTKSFVEGISLQNIHFKNIQGLRFFGVTKDSLLSSEFDGIILGRMLSERLGLNLADTVVLISFAATDSVVLPTAKFAKVKVAGIFESGMAKYDDLVVFASDKVLSRILGDLLSNVNAFDIYLDDIKKADKVSKEIEQKLGYPFFCFTYYDMHSSIFAWIELQKQPIPLVLSLITIVAVFNVVTFLLVSIVEKTKSIGILLTLGLNSKDIVLIFLKLASKITLTGLLIGISVSLFFSFLQKEFQIIHLDPKVYFFSALPITISAKNYLLVTLFTCLLSFAVSAIPSFIASKIKPVEAIRFIK
ncbi:MAG: ABC transporter permease, partial [Candidatus Kapaibacteriota bacterium]